MRAVERDFSPEILEKGKLIKEKMDASNFIMFDVDSIAIKLPESTLKYYNRVIYKISGNKVNYQPIEFKDWDQFQIWARENGVKEELAGQMWRVWNYKNATRNAKVVEGFRDIFKEVLDLKKPYGFATSRPNKLEVVTHEWFWEKVPEVDTNKLQMRDGNERIKGWAFKTSEAIKKAQEYGSVLVFEDFPPHAYDIVLTAEKKNLDICVVLVPYPNVPISDEIINNKRIIIFERDKDESLGLKGLAQVITS